MEIVLVALQPNDLAFRIAHTLNRTLIIPTITSLADSELLIEFPAYEWEHKIVLLVHSLASPVHEHIVQLALAADALKALNVKVILGIIPYLGYARHYTRTVTPTPAHTIIRMLEATAIDHFIIVEPHAIECLALFAKPVTPVLLDTMLTQQIAAHMVAAPNYCIVAPDQGAFARAHTIAQNLHRPLLVYHKQRLDHETVTLAGVEGSCTSDTAIIVDDIVNTGQTMIQVSNDLFNRGVRTIIGYGIHPLFSAGARQAIEASHIHTLFVSNSIACVPDKKVKIFDMSDALITTLSSLLGTLSV
jgi:ribose-phosphate pyrophosphokinase